MSDDFIPLNQSTPMQGMRQQGRNNDQMSFQNRYQNGSQRRGGYNNRRGNRGNRSYNSSYGSDSNSSFGQDNRSGIDAYLQPSMLQDPWAKLRQKNNS